MNLRECSKCGHLFEGKSGYCKPCQKVYDAAKYIKNKAVIDARNAKWAAEHPETCKEGAARWRQLNRLSARRNTRLWRQRNMGHDAARAAVRRGARRQAVPSWVNRFFVGEAYELAQRRSRVMGITWQVDHIVPLVSDLVCGLHVENNLRLVPAVDNQSKGNRYWPGMP